MAFQEGFSSMELVLSWRTYLARTIVFKVRLDFIVKVFAWGYRDEMRQSQQA
jgi:hypothetical protein